ncbi:hypothetical protein QE361_001889 [Sphingomonas sp. SORGH_AS802]|uniref:hypothetical protein n=1 Tax=unclassified Sphingomonas TaxID=196159 RepID=UPI0028658DEB|nr:MULTISPECIES: hypothetical protein [unclassified Sphingomonas]MDR6126729.1 hypothetical protein [Sphingomonas sp. SORGH_AS_0438]MDR6134906.1 hypothetical protein [Sphingomonas sp. SORGH_AS_0802]
MADQVETALDVTEQLKELSDLARRGRSSVVNTGPIMLIWGVAIMVASLTEQLLQRSAYTVVAWIAPFLIAYFISLIMMRLSHSDGRAVTWRSRAVHRIWIAAGAAVVVFNIGEELHRSGLQSESEAATALILSVAALATAELANRKALSVIGIGWMTIALALLSVGDMSLLVMLGVAAFVLQIVPSLFLLREEWKA